MSLPDFLCIGAQKAGTSWLNHMLLQHPQIFMPPVNELHYFDGKDRPFRPRHHELARKAARREAEKGNAADPAYLDYLARLMSFGHRTLDWYRAAYAWPVAEGARRGDITPSYLALSRNAITEARRLLGPVRIILIVRRPADRLLSQLRMWAQRDDRDDMPETEAEWLDLLRDMTSRPDRGSYGKGIARWSKAFGEDAMLVLPFGDIRTDPRGLMDRVEAHLGLSRHDYTRLADQIHVTHKVELPEAVRAAATEMTAGEDDFLRQSFGEDFLARTR